MNFSSLQNNIFDFALTKSDSLIVEAVAGSGKTTTEKETVQRLARSKLQMASTSLFAAFKQSDFLALAFNKHIAEVWQKELPPNCEASTVHSAGYSICRSQLGSKSVDRYGKKVDDILTALGVPDPWKIKHDSDAKEEAQKIRFSIKSIVSICKSTLTYDVAEMPNICDFYNVYVHDPVLFPTVKEVLLRCAADTTTVDFDDMCWLPVYLNCRLPQYDCVLVDEQQDMNRCQNELIKRFNSRVIAVGDRHQSLYGFRGADPSSMDWLKTALAAHELPLSISYRCAKSIVNLAQTLVPQIQARDNAPEGKVLYTTEDDFLHNVNVGDMIVCRYNAPLIGIALDIIANGIKVNVRGRDIGKNIAIFASKFCKPAKTMDQMRGLLSEHVKRELAKHGSRASKQNLIDKVSVVKTISRNCRFPHEVPSAIEDIFSDDKGVITLSSIHRAKGDEAKNVFVREVEPVWLKNVTLQLHEQEQENNCKYVAWTRAKDTLTIVKDKDEESTEMFNF